MHRTLRIALAALILAAGPTNAAFRDIAVSGFRGVDVTIPMDLEILQGPVDSLRLDGDEAAIAQVEIVVEDGIVRILARDRSVSWKGRLRGVLRAKRIDTVVLAGSGSIQVAQLAGDDVKATLSGNGKLNLERIEARSAGLFLSGTGTIRAAAGRVQGLEVGIAGTGDVEAPRLQSVEARVAISGSGAATVAARESLQVRISGTGKVGYYGDPRLQERGVGVGKVSRLGAHPG